MSSLQEILFILRIAERVTSEHRYRSYVARNDLLRSIRQLQKKHRQLLYAATRIHSTIGLHLYSMWSPCCLLLLACLFFRSLSIFLFRFWCLVTDGTFYFLGWFGFIEKIINIGIVQFLN